MRCDRILSAVLFLVGMTVMFSAISKIHAQELVGSDGTIKRGWNWYEAPPITEEADPDIATKPVVPPIDQLRRMTPEAIGDIMEQQLAYAIASEEVAEVATYYTLLDFVRRRSRTFTALTSIAMLQNPALNARTDYPVTNAGRTVKSRERKVERNQRLVREGHGYALIMFSSEGCGFCNVQWGTIQAFKDATGWAIRRLDIAEFPGRAARFNIEATPTTILIEKGSDAWFPVSVGVESLPVISDNAYRAIRLLSGEINQQQFFNYESDDGGFFDPSNVQQARSPGELEHFNQADKRTGR